MTAVLKFVFSIVFVLGLAFPLMGQAQAEYPDAVEIRAREVGRKLRCVVCQNQSIEESDAALAADMRIMVRDRLVAGESEADIIAFMQDRYGDYVLLMPPVQGNTIILWVGPVAFVLVFMLWWIVSVRRKPTTEAVVSPRSTEDAEKLSMLRKADQ